MYCLIFNSWKTDTPRYHPSTSKTNLQSQNPSYNAFGACTFSLFLSHPPPPRPPRAVVLTPRIINTPHPPRTSGSSSLFMACGPTMRQGGGPRTATQTCDLTSPSWMTSSQVGLSDSHTVVFSASACACIDSHFTRSAENVGLSCGPHM